MMIFPEHEETPICLSLRVWDTYKYTPAKNHQTSIKLYKNTTPHRIHVWYIYLIPLEIPIGPWGSWFYRYRIKLPAPMSHRSTTEYEPPGKIKKNGQYRIWAPKIEFDSLFWGGEGGVGTNLEQPQIRQINSMYRMVPSGYWGDLVSQKIIKLNLAQPILYRFLCCISFLGGLDI